MVDGAVSLLQPLEEVVIRQQLDRAPRGRGQVEHGAGRNAAAPEESIDLGVLSAPTDCDAPRLCRLRSVAGLTPAAWRSRKALTRYRSRERRSRRHGLSVIELVIPVSVTVTT